MSTCRAWLLLPLLLAGCALPPADQGGGPPAMVKAPRVEADEVSRALAYYAQARQLTGIELARECESARRELMRTRSDANRVRYAMLLTLPGAPVTEEPRAQEVLEPVTRSHDGGLRGLAQLMMASLQEQRRIETHAQGLQQKLDALLTLERNMTRDGSGTRKR